MNTAVQKSLNQSVSEKIPTHQLIQKTRIIAINSGLFENNPDNVLILECLKLDCIEFLNLTVPQATMSMTGGKA